jgi:hypothetical protein
MYRIRYGINRIISKWDRLFIRCSWIKLGIKIEYKCENLEITCKIKEGQMNRL